MNVVFVAYIFVVAASAARLAAAAEAATTKSLTQTGSGKRAVNSSRNKRIPEVIGSHIPVPIGQ